MGCFSFLCKECGKGIKSSSFDGEQVKLWLLRDGKPIQEMEGEYDSYGQVFIDDTVKDGRNGLRESVYWKDPTPDVPLSEYHQKKGIDNPGNHGYWLRVCNLMSEDSGPSNGIAAIHTKCFTGKIPTTSSEDDPNQGWGEDDELLGATSGEYDD